MLEVEGKREKESRHVEAPIYSVQFCRPKGFLSTHYSEAFASLAFSKQILSTICATEIKPPSPQCISGNGNDVTMRLVS